MIALQTLSIGAHVIAVPGRHEARALTDCCPDLGCMTACSPVTVLDEVRDGQVITRVGSYRCRCGLAWLCCWSPALTGGDAA